jgi:hypothetical protein
MRILMFIFLVSACASPAGQLTDKGRAVELLNSKPTKCEVIGKVVAKDHKGSSELAINRARNKAAAMKANALYVDQEIPNGKAREVNATAYRCN